MAKYKKVRALGIMNGTSLDAIDYALISTNTNLSNIQFEKHKHFPIPKNLKSKLLSAATNKLTTFELSELNYELGRLYAKQLKSLKRTWRWDVIGLHGQTVHHNGKVATLQIGQPAFAHQACQCPIVYDFRAADIAAGGQGAPFAPFFQNALYQASKVPVSFHNLGGISNFTYFKGKQVLAFDTGPANILMDQWVQEKKSLAFDKNGKLAAKGLYDPRIVHQFLTHPYFQTKPPKSCGREEFNLKFIKDFGKRSFQKLNFNDQMATLAELTAVSISEAYQKWCKSLPKTIYFYGGGVNNPYLMERIQFQLPKIEIKTTQDLGWPSQAFEASVFAFLGTARWVGKKVHLPSLTGAKKAQHLGSILS